MSTPKQQLTPIKVLLVEDSEDDALLLVHHLREAGFATDWIRVENEADYRRHLYPDLDVILSDFSLPQLTTQRAIQVLKESALDIPFLVVSGTIGEERAVECLRAGAVDYILKDRPKRLGSAVVRALRETRERADRRRAERTLRESEERFRQLAENINEVFWIKDVERQRMVYVSPAYETIWGRTSESLYQSPLNWLESIHPDDQERVLMASARQSLGQYCESYRIVRPDQSTRWIRDRAFPVHDEDGSVKRIVGVAEDITEERQLEEQLRRSQKMDGIGQLAGGVAHDFNNLLAIIQCNTELVLMDAKGLAPDVRDSLTQVVQASERAADLARQLLAFSRRQIVELQPLDLGGAITNLTRMLNRVIGEHINLECLLEEGLPLVNADVGMIDQIVLNLVVNARDAMPRGGVLTLSTSLASIDEKFLKQQPQAKLGDFVCLTVEDTGYGISKENLSHIFEPFFTTKEVGRGTGLGLSTVYGIVQQHQGWINVKSELNHGSSFQVYLPALSRSAASAAKSPEVEVSGGTETILLVEDEPALRQLTQSILERYGYKVYEADNGATALQRWRERKALIDLLITDMVMPGGIDGRELVERIRAEMPALAVVCVSGYAANVISTGFTSKKGLQFLQKPYSPVTLARTVRMALDANR